MKLRHKGSEFFVPDNLPAVEALTRTTHMGIFAHPDDLQTMAYDGILKCCCIRTSFVINNSYDRLV